MTREILPLLCASFMLLPLSARGQQSSTQQQSAAPTGRRRSRGVGTAGAGGGGGSSRGGGSGGAAPMKELPCPKGFTAQKDSGPHLELASRPPAKTKKGRKSSSSPDEGQAPAMKKTFARRCVPDKSKSAASSGAKRTNAP